MISQKLFEKLLKHLNEIPFGTYNDKVIIPRHMEEYDVVKWVNDTYELREELQGIKDYT